MSQFSKTLRLPQPPPTRLSPPVLPPPATPAAPPPVAVASDPLWVADEFNILRRLGLWFALAFVFARFSLVSEIISYGMGMKPFLIIVLGPPAVACVFLTGGLRRSLRQRAGIAFLAFIIWLLVVTPFSVWKGGTLKLLSSSFQTEFSMFFMVAGLTLTMQDCRRMAWAIGLASMVNILASLRFGSMVNGRFAMQFGTLMNPNDYGTHMLLCAPFLLFMFFSSNRISFLRLLSISAAALGLFMVFRTGSRSAILALGAMMLFILVRATVSQRIVLVSSLGLLSFVALLTLPRVTLQRYVTIFTNQVEDVESMHEYLVSVGSSEARKELLKNSLRLTFENPLFGVGPGMFAVGEADLATSEGQRGHWQVSHNSYTEVSSESGIPGFLFFVLTMLFAMGTLWRIYRLASQSPALVFARNLSFCLLLSLVGFSISIFFASMAYRYYVPALVGLVVAFASAFEHEMRQQQAQQNSRALAN